VSLFPVLLDASPGYLRTTSRQASLLLTPIGSGTLLCRIHSRLSAAGSTKLIVMPTFHAGAAYKRELRSACDQVGSVVGVEQLRGVVSQLEASDWILFIDPQCATLDPIDPAALLQAATSPPTSAAHLVALDSNVGGTLEWVDIDDRGDIARIQRFYDEVTWPYTSGVVASLVPVPCLLTERRLRFASLRELRVALAARGVPARDVAASSPSFDLTSPRELLSMADSVVRASAASQPATRWIGSRAAVHESARIVGPVLVQEGSRIGARATVVGPSTIGAGAMVGDGATVVQSVVLSGAEVAAGSVVRRQLVSSVDAYHDAPDPVSPGAAYDLSQAREFRSTSDHEAAPRRLYPAIKQAVDSALSIVALILLLPLFALIAVLIKLESHGPVFFADRREAAGGRPFRCLKFRTMIQGADRLQRALQAKNDVDGPQFKIEKDPRITRIGRWIRPCSFDELPQLINVAIGQMSLVGPRPSPFRENQTCVPWRQRRLSVRPGITGLWQVCRHHRSDGDFHQWIHYDLLYVEHMSAGVDFKIVLATILTLGGKWCVPLTWIIPERKLRQAA
jgi:lipopolysaccharide/colanic/teichoic acid biosynthesis glycosyltransferase/acetyltransferase-like isoleucine patch superfamily enzyme